MRKGVGLTGAGLLVVFLAVASMGLRSAHGGSVNGTIDVAIDVDTTGNGDTVLGPTQSCNATPLKVGDTIDVDVVVRGIPEYSANNAASGTGGWDAELVFDPTVLQLNLIKGFNGPTILNSVAENSHVAAFSYAVDGNPAPPGTTGRAVITMISLGGLGNVASGDGVMFRVTFEAVHEGVGRIETAYEREPIQVYNPVGLNYMINRSDAVLAVGSGSCSNTPSPLPTPTPFPSYVPPSGSPTPTIEPLPRLALALDADVAANENNDLGPTDTCNAIPLAVGDVLDIDAVIRGVVPYNSQDRRGGISGFGFQFSFDPKVLEVEEVQGLSGPSILTESGYSAELRVIDYDPLSGDTNGPPGTRGTVAVAVGDTSFNFESGDGILTRIALKAIGSGVSRIDLFETEVLDGAGNPYPNAVTPGSIVVGSGDCLAMPTIAPTATPSPTPTPRHPPTGGSPSFTPPRTPVSASPRSGTPTATLGQTSTQGQTSTPRELPHTGGTAGRGTAWPFALGGVVLVLTAAGAFAVARRRV